MLHALLSASTTRNRIYDSSEQHMHLLHRICKNSYFDHVLGMGIFFAEFMTVIDAQYLRERAGGKCAETQRFVDAWAMTTINLR